MNKIWKPIFLDTRGYDFLIASLALRADLLSKRFLNGFVRGVIPTDSPRFYISGEPTLGDFDAMTVALNRSGEDDQCYESLQRSLQDIHPRTFPLHLYWTQFLRTLGDEVTSCIDDILCEIEGSLYFHASISTFDWQTELEFKRVVVEGRFPDRQIGFLFDSEFNTKVSLDLWLESSLLAIMASAYDGQFIIVSPRISGKWSSVDFRNRGIRKS